MKKIFALLTVFLIYLFFPANIHASGPSLGIHLLDPNELNQALELAGGDPQNPGAVTVVLRVDDRDSNKWQNFFDIAQENHITPIIRLATQITESGWRRPCKKDILEHAEFLTSLNWHSRSLLLVAFNEPNHAAEWGGEINPEDYAQILEFTLDWFHTEPKEYLVLPAGLDAAAPSGPDTLDSFIFMNRMFNSNPGILEKIDGWTSHAYPNPGFIASPYASGKASIRGYQNELQILKNYLDREFPVYITETGWRKTAQNIKKLPEYYTYAYEKVWNHEDIKAITPFVFAAYSGPFHEFSFVNSDGSPTPQYLAWKSLKNKEKDDSYFYYLALKQLP